MRILGDQPHGYRSARRSLAAFRRIPPLDERETA
jgi:hypothetical protein